MTRFNQPALFLASGGAVEIGRKHLMTSQNDSRQVRRAADRADLDRTELVVSIKRPMVRASTAVPCTVTDTGERYADTPFRDGAHASWDSAVLGGLPVFVIAPDGYALAARDTSHASDTGPGRDPK